MNKVIVIGLDGATWDLLLPLAENGFLPNLRRLCASGVHGELESTIPPVTAPAWASFATGKNPGKTGIFDFLLPRGALSRLTPITTADIPCDTFYELLHELGKKFILVNLPLSYPPRTTQPTITSILTQGNRFIFPEDLASQVPDLKEYRITPNFDLKVRGDIQGYAHDIRQLEETRFKCCQKLFELEWDLFFMLFSGPDWVQHEVYDKLVSGNLNRDHDAFLLYRDIDDYIGWFMEHMPNDATLFVMSDHGFKTYKGLFYINQWLRQKGLLRSMRCVGGSVPPQHRIVEGIREAQARLGPSRRDIGRLRLAPPAALLQGLKRLGVGRLYALLEDRLPFRVEADTAVDHAGSAAICTTPELWGIYLNVAGRFGDGVLNADEATGIKDTIIAELRNLGIPGTSIPAFQSVASSSDAYSGTLTATAPDLVIVPSDYCLAAGLRMARNEPCFEERSINGHSLTGILAACGPNVRRGVQIAGSSICDLAPTILHILDAAVPSDMDGKVLSVLFEEDSEVLQRPIRYAAPSQKDAIRQRIAGVKKRRKV